MSGIKPSIPIQPKQSDEADELNLPQDDPRFPHVTYRRGVSGKSVPVIRGTGLRVQTIVICTYNWGETPAEIADDYGFITEEQVRGALAFYEVHRAEIDAHIEYEAELARQYERERMQEAR